MGGLNNGGDNLGISPRKDHELLGLGIREKLANLRDYMPDQDQLVYDFANFLSTRTNDRLVPEGFNMMAFLALYDLQRGIDGFTNQPIQGRIAGYPVEVYTILNMYIPAIAEALFGKEYAKRIENIRNRIEESLRNKK